MYSESMCTHQD